MKKNFTLTEIIIVVVIVGIVITFAIPSYKNIIEKALNKENKLVLKPSPKTEILIDKNYIMASLGVLSKKHPEAALILLKESLEIR